MTATSEVFRFAVQRPVQRARPKQVAWRSIGAYVGSTSTTLHQDLRAKRSQAGVTRADLREVVEAYVAGGNLLQGLGSVRLKDPGQPESLADLDLWLLDRDDGAAPNEVAERVKALSGRDLKTLVKPDNVLYYQGRNKVADGLLALTVHPLGREGLREELLRGLRILGQLERLAAKEQDAEPKDGSGVRRYLASAIVLLPEDVFPLPIEPEPLPSPVPTVGATSDGSTVGLSDVLEAARELRAAFRADSGPGAETNGDSETTGDFGSGAPWGLSRTAQAELREVTRRTVRELAGPAAFAAVPEAIDLLEREAASLWGSMASEAVGRRTLAPLGGSFLDLTAFRAAAERQDNRPGRVPADALVRAPGVIELKVVRQQLDRYELSEVAHVENVLKGELKERSHRTRTAVETTLLVETERTEQLEQELQSTERFELQTETSRTAHEDAHLEGGVQARASYGPTLEVTANAGFALNTAKEEATRRAQTYARDVTQRSVTRIQERIKEQRTVRSLTEVEEINKHAVDNAKGEKHVVGVYRFVDKIYKAQLFDYGKRMLLEFNVPEPAAFFLHSRHNRAPEGLTVERPDPPAVTHDPDTGTPLAQARSLAPTDLRPHNFAAWIRQYAVAGAEVPPKEFETIAVVIEEPVTEEDDQNKKRKVVFKTTKELTVPAGYEAIRYKIMSHADNGRRETMLLSWSVGDSADHFAGDPTHDPPVHAPWSFRENRDLEHHTQGSVPVSLYYADVWGLVVTVQVICQRTGEALREWQLKTYEQIMRAYHELKDSYNDEVVAASARQGLGVRGSNPQLNREVEREELKKATISMLRGGRLEGFDAVYEDQEPPGYPEIKVAEAQDEGRLIQFFEQAFEWPQMTYVFYPYFWGRKSLWAERSSGLDNPDPLFSAFLRAGAARVAVPVRRGFEDLVNAYLATDQVWGGGSPPTVGTSLYLSVAQEIRELQDANTDGVPEGDPWEVRVPTTLMYLQQGASLSASPAGGG